MTIFHLISSRIKQITLTIKCVGGVIFNAFNDMTLQEMHDNHKAVVHNPMMGIPHTPFSVVTLKTIFMLYFVIHVHDANAFLQSVKYSAPHVAKDIKEKSAAAEMNHLGTSGANIFYCSNYLSPQHIDYLSKYSLPPHGTMAPAASVIQHAKYLCRGALSTGGHLTVRERDRQRAHAIADMHRYKGKNDINKNIEDKNNYKKLNI
ncbi:uncharacterized protein EDB91DRAFT_1089267 [Suillus paluster]|uniref:uncharacterized protein n=1 Tax=Suillus paluster TaxID=48578 RepID=UPI001B85DC6B|nr:uncharacterized protein EDB91DRAFT_1089267 [Suillus paluster]KAG1719535.1 hypothetical protein EDB91DRAFT_1089267 [Suillus paluster]